MTNFLNFLDPVTADLIVQVSIAAFLGVLIGTERSAANKTAGMRTYALVSMGSALFVIISHIVSSQYIGLTNFDPLRVASQIVVGIGFVGGGLIMTQGRQISGITTAAGLWVSAGIGMAVGFRLYALATFVTLMTLLIFTVLWHIESALKRHSNKLYTHRERHADPHDDI